MIEGHDKWHVFSQAGSPPKPSWQRLSDSWEAGKAAKVKLQPPQPADSPAYGDGSLLRMLAATRGRGVPFIAPSARLFFTEPDLVFQASVTDFPLLLVMHCLLVSIRCHQLVAFGALSHSFRCLRPDIGLLI